MDLLATTAGSAMAWGLIALAPLSYRGKENMTKVPQHSPLKFNETRQQKKRGGQTIKSVFNIHSAAGLRQADIDGGMSGRH